MNRAYKYRLVPNHTQVVLLNKTMGCVRWYWNNLVATFKTYDKENNPTPEFKTGKELKQDCEWLGEISAAALQQKRQDFEEFRKQLFNKNRKSKIGFPKFKKKCNKQSYRLPNQKFDLRGDKIRLEKIGLVKLVIDRPIPDDAKLINVTVSMNSAGQYFVSICVDTIIEHKPKTNNNVGIDLGLKEFAVLSDNNVINNPRLYRESQSKLARLQRYYSRKQKGSHRQKKCRLKIARLHNKIANQRAYFLHNVTTELITNFDTIYIEDLNVAGMVKNHCLAKSISDVSFGEFRRLLEYKAKWYGKEVVVIGRFEPSSKTCSVCGWINKDLTLKDRVFECKECGAVLDRDLNAAQNIKAFGVSSAIRTMRGAVTNLDEASKMN